MRWIDRVLQDLRFAVRTLRRSPAFTIVAALTLALGIGSTTAAFSVVDTVVLRGLPYRDAERLQTVYERSDDGNFRVPSFPTFLDWQSQSVTVRDAIEGFAFVRGNGVMMPTPKGAERQIAAYVTPGFFQLMGTRPVLGRSFLPDEERPGAPRVGVISHDYFMQHFGGDPSVIGKTVAVDSVPTTIVGVMPHAFAYPNFSGSDYWITPVIWQPISVFQETHNALTLRGLHVDSRAVVRLRAGVDSARAAGIMRTIALRLAAEYPVEQAHWTAVAFRPIADELFGSLRQTLLLVTGAIGLVLLLACANVANLFLVRASGRARELAVRTALGANRLRLAGQLLTESFVLAAAAGALGILVASMLVGYVRRNAGARLPLGSALAVDARVALFAIAASMAAALLVGTLPAIQAGSTRLMQRMRSDVAAAVGGARERWIRNVLVAVQFALALTLLMGAGLLIQSFRRIASVPLGFDASGVIDFAIEPPAHRYEEPAQAAALYRRVLDALQALPAVTDAAAAGGALLPAKVESDVPSTGRQLPEARYHPVSAEYLRTLRIPMVEGRWFTADDMRAPVGFVVNQRLANLLWPGASALGHRVTVRRSSQARADFGQPITMPVIGVVADVRQFGPTSDPEPEIFLPYTLEVWPWMNFVVRARDAERMLPTVERTLRAVEPGLVYLGKPSVMRSGAAAIEPQRRFVTFVLTGFASCALLLAAIGLYGTVAYTVVQRRRELGVRIALGASERSILSLVMADGMKFVLAGAVFGVAGAFASARIIRTMLFQTTTTDTATFAVVPIVLAAVAGAASYLSGRRAAKTDPMIVIKGE